MTFSPEILTLAAEVLGACRAHEWKIATAESCTGGLLAGALTTMAGSSDCFTHGFVTYANEAKIQMLGVNQGDLDKYGAVSEIIARQMATGALGENGAGIAASITGIAGPDSDDSEKPVGLIHCAVAWRDDDRSHINIRHQQYNSIANGREAIRLDAVKTALTMILDAAQLR